MHSDRDDGSSLSPTLITRYGQKSSRLIRSIEKNIYIVIGVVVALAVISIIDTLEIIGITDFINENLDDPIVAILSVVSLASLVPILRLSINSKKTLEEWAQMFENNSIKNLISMSLTSRSRDEAIRCVAEAIEEIGDPLLRYLENGEPTEFLGKEIAGHFYDVLIDYESVKQSKAAGAELARLLKDYGAIIIKIVEGSVGKDNVASFSSSLSAYRIQKHRKDGIGLAIIIGKEISEEAYAKDRTENMLLIEKQ